MLHSSKYKGPDPTARAKAENVRELRNAGVRPAEKPDKLALVGLRSIGF